MSRILQDPGAIADWLHGRVTGALRCDSRQIQPGDGFVAWPGAATDGRRFVRDALEAGATAVLVERDGLAPFGFDDDRILAVPALKTVTGAVASAFHGNPSAAMEVAAFTGTNGKTSSAWWMAQLLSAAGKPCAVVGTLGVGRPPLATESGHELVPTGLTTPDPVLLQTSLREMVDSGTQACAMEASSIGLVQGRLNGTHVRVAVFTNFTQDHLDFHGSMAAYWQAKRALFAWPDLSAAVINLDDPAGETLASELAAGSGLDVWTVAIDAPARLSARALAMTHEGLSMRVVECDRAGAVLDEVPVSVPLVGRYNVSNLLGVLAAARALGLSLGLATRALDGLTPVPGRMERVGAAPGKPLVLVDYAHTPDALEKALQAVQPLARHRGGRLWVVIGCGGDRDPVKRPVMAGVAQREADGVVLTSDNPRSEDPLAILAQMQRGLQRPDQVLIEPDRALAIARAVGSAGSEDVVLVAGKGHEDYQE
ncbi:MAG: UDP-N-acetylmuramoyl-L-alanyl-D-glutamate--2,6-diaminopimelate ligase, partial [Gammaproteobacteria bacterium]